jgi:2-amino-4-hydroxy-6-hydroxymethyldihydropteridine diphosphokinase
VYETEPWGLHPSLFFSIKSSGREFAFSPPVKTPEVDRSKIRAKTNNRYGPRVIDIDLLFYNALVINRPDLIIPHPKLPERAFVLVPLAEYRPGFRSPRPSKDGRRALVTGRFNWCETF